MAQNWKMVAVLVVAVSISGCSLIASKAKDMILSPEEQAFLEVNAYTAAGNSVASQENEVEVEGDNATITTDQSKEANDSKVEAGEVDHLEVYNTQIPLWVMLLLVIGWLAPSPSNMYNEIKSWFTK